MGAASVGCCQGNVEQHPREDDLQEYQSAQRVPAPQQIAPRKTVFPFTKAAGVVEHDGGLDSIPVAPSTTALPWSTFCNQGCSYVQAEASKAMRLSMGGEQEGRVTINMLPSRVSLAHFAKDGFQDDLSEQEEESFSRGNNEPESNRCPSCAGEQPREHAIKPCCCRGSRQNEIENGTISMLQNFDAGGHILVHVLASTGIALVSTLYIKQLCELGELLPRRQDLRGDMCVSGRNLDRQLRNGPQVFVVSHAWLTEEHPDPTGVRVKELANTLDMLSASDDDLVFLDYCSLPQCAHGWSRCTESRSLESRSLESRSLESRITEDDFSRSRSAQENRWFKAARANMDVIFASGRATVLVFPKVHDVSDAPAIFTRNTRAYLGRAWCCLEFSVALYFRRLAGGSTPHFGEADDDVRNALLDYVIPDADLFEDMVHTSRLRTSRPEDVKVVCNTFKRFYWGRRLEGVVNR